MIGIPENLLRVITPEVGGGFGSKLNVYAEEALMCFVAMRILKPVKWVESRRENFTCTIHGRGHVDYFELAAKRDGTMLGMRLKLIQALAAFDYTQLRAQQERERAAGKLMGIGVSTYGEICAMGPSVALPAGGWESATVKIEPTGKVTVMTGASPHGQGEETTFAQIVADELGVAMDDVQVVHGDTAIVQYGIGTFGSRGTAVGGAALYFALQELKAKIKKFGALLLKSERVTLPGGACIDDATGKSVSFAEIAA